MSYLVSLTFLCAFVYSMFRFPFTVVIGAMIDVPDVLDKKAKRMKTHHGG